MDHKGPRKFLFKLKHAHLNENVNSENFRHFLGICDIKFEDSSEACVNYIFKKMFNVEPFSSPTKLEHLLEVLDNMQTVAFCIIQEKKVYFHNPDNRWEDKPTIVIYGNHCYKIDKITELIEADLDCDLNVKTPVQMTLLDGYSKEGMKLCKRCLAKYKPAWFDVGFCTITCAALGLPVNKLCKGCGTLYLTHKFLDNDYCSLMCRCFPTKEAQAKMWLFFDKSNEDLLAQYRNDFLSNEEACLMFEAQDFFGRLSRNELTQEDLKKMQKKILEHRDKLDDFPLIYILDNKEDVFKKKPKLCLGYYTTPVKALRPYEPIPKCLPRDSEGFYHKYRSEEYLHKYSYNLDPLLLQDLKNNVLTHEHLCFSCGTVYEHSHKYYNETHPQFIKQCGNLDCFMYGLKSKPKVYPLGLFDINKKPIFQEEHVEKVVINSLNIVNPKPNFSLNKLLDYDSSYLSKNFKNGENIHPHPNLAFDRYFLEKWMYSEVIKQPHYVMAAAPKRISKWNDENFFSVPYVVETDLERQEELRLVPNKFCYHKLEDCDHLQYHEILTGTHTMYYITKENYKYIKHMKYMCFVVHLYFDNLPKEEIEEITYEVEVKMSVKGNKASYKHRHPIEALRLLDQDYNIVIIGSMAYTQLLFLTRKDLSLGTSDFLERYERGLLLRGVTGNENDFDMLERDYDIY